MVLLEKKAVMAVEIEATDKKRAMCTHVYTHTAKKGWYTPTKPRKSDEILIYHSHSTMNSLRAFQQVI